MKKWDMFAVLGVALVVIVASLVSRRAPSGKLPPDFLDAVSPGYIAEALHDLVAAPIKPRISFCWQLHSNSVTPDARCADLYAKFPGEKENCGIQNLVGGNWDGMLVARKDTDFDAIAESISKQGCRNLMLDIESLEKVSPEDVSQWFSSLVAALRQKILGAKISIAVHAKTDDAGSWEGSRVQDWRSLCGLSDELVVMAYDYSYPGITPPGETAPLPWFEQVARYAVSRCSAEKVRLGLAAYGYRWSDHRPVSEREKAAKPSDYADVIVETQAQRDQKVQLAERLGFNKFFLWASGMEASASRD